MKRIINGRTYNTETAAKIDYYDNGLPISDFGECTEVLYQTRRGAFFLHGNGGPQTRWATRHSDGMRSRGEGLLPLDEQEVREWLEYHSDAETYARLFGEPDEAGAEPASGVGYLLRMPSDLKGRAEIAAERAGTSLNTWISRAVEQALA